MAGIYSPSHAALLVGRAGEKYRPSNATEGDFFFAAWCCKCQRDEAMREGCNVDECDDNERCDIIVKTMAFHVSDPDYPAEWRYGPDGQPMCAAFVAAGIEVRPTAAELEAHGQMRLVP
jgi:hypothetical protein